MSQIYLVVLLIFSALEVRAQISYGEDWLTDHPRSERVLLTHKNKKMFVLLTRFESESSEEDFEEFFAGRFSELARSVRSGQIESEDDVPLNMHSGSSTFRGVRFGETSFAVEFRQSKARFRERIWMQDKMLWHLAMVDMTENAPDHKNEIEKIMGKLIHKKTSSLFSVSLNAYASDCVNCELPNKKRISELDKLIPKIQAKSKEQNCMKLPIHFGNRSPSYGIKIHEASYSSCLTGAGNAVRAMKNGFLSSLNSWQKETEKRSKSLGCHEPELGKGFLASIAYSHLMDAYQKCLTSASMGAGASLVVQSLGQTARSLQALYRWVKAEDNPIGVMTSILAAKYEGFMCLSPDAQVRSICEFSTHFLAALGAGATGAGSVVAITKGVSAVRKLASLPPKKSLPETLAFKKVNGVSATFVNAHPFIRRVASGNAEAAKVIQSLKNGAILSKSTKEMDTLLKRRGFTRIDTCIKAQGKCVRHINPVTGKMEVAPMIVYVHPSGLAARLKPHGQTNAKFRPEPHGSFMLVDPGDKNLAGALAKVKTNAQKEKFMNEYLSWEKELAKVDMKSGTPLPSAPSRARIPAGLSASDKAAFEDTLAGLVHFNLK